MGVNFKDIKMQYKKLKTLLGAENELTLSAEDACSCQDALKMLEDRGYIIDTSTLSGTSYLKTAEWDGFEEWLNSELKEAKRISRREWIIGIVCAVVGAIIGLLPYIITLFERES